eukprot:8515083-Karenia_brevis.AAC.1
MRVVRRRHDCCRFSDKVESDALVRQRCNIASVDCILQRKRLLYLARLLVRKPKSLMALLFASKEKKKLPWTRLIINDMCFVRTESLQFLPPPCIGHADWSQYILDDVQRWREVATSLHYTASCTDKEQVPGTPASLSFVCQMCNPACGFASEKGLAQHQRMKHGLRNMMRYYISGPVCPVCETDFQDRIRCLAHVSDCRRSKCRGELLSGSFAMLDEDQVCQLDEIDARLRKEARRSGRTHHIAVEAARTVDGKITGRVTSVPLRRLGE